MSTPTIELATTEARRFVRNPLIWMSFAPTVLWARAALRAGGVEDRLFLLVGYGFLLPGYVMCAAVLLATLRSRYAHADELLDTLALSPDRRSVAHAASTLALGAIGAFAIVVFILVLRPGRTLGHWNPATDLEIEIPRPTLAQLLQGPLAIVAVAPLVVALVRWIPTWLVLAPLLFMIMVQGLYAGIFHGIPADGGRWLFPLNSGVVNGRWIGCVEEDAVCDLTVSGFDRDTPWWHLGFLIATSGWFTTLAVLRHRRDRRVWWWLGATSAALLLFGSTQIAVAESYGA